MLKIRLQRIGRINNPAFRLVVVEHTESTKTGSFVERVGTYNPKSKERVLNAERIKYWMSVGAQPSGTVHNMLISAGVITGKKINVLPQKSPPKKEDEVAEAAPAASVVEAPAEASAEKSDEVPAEAAETPAAA